MASKREPNKTEITPKGIRIDYWDSIGIDGQPQQRRYAVNGEKFPSITTVGGSMDKFGLTPAAAKLERQGVAELVRRGFDVTALSDDDLRALLKEHGLHYDSVWEVARQRGDVAHEHLLHLLRDNEVARLSDYAPDLHPWISAGMRWALDARPEWIDGERMVASVEHGFVGRFDLLAGFPDGRVGRVEFKTVTEWKRAKRKNGDGPLLPPYFENLIQGEGYEIAARESGYQESDFRLIVRLGPDGDYDVCEPSWVTEYQYLAVFYAYTAKKAVESGRPAKAEVAA